MKEVFAIFDIWSKLTDAGKAEAREYLRGLSQSKAPQKGGAE